MTKWGQNMAILTIRLFLGPSGGLVVKWGQNMAISRIRLYGRPENQRAGEEIALFPSQPI